MIHFAGFGFFGIVLATAQRAMDYSARGAAALGCGAHHLKISWPEKRDHPSQLGRQRRKRRWPIGRVEALLAICA